VALELQSEPPMRAMAQSPKSRLAVQSFAV
jgi:hypothetical protein